MIDYDKILSQRAVAIKPSGIRKFFDIAAEMDDVISLGVGEPDFKTPWSIRHAGAESLEKGRTWYTANAGLAPLRTEISNYLKRRFFAGIRSQRRNSRHRRRLRGHRHLHPRAHQPRRRNSAAGAVLCGLCAHGRPGRC